MHLACSQNWCTCIYTSIYAFTVVRINAFTAARIGVFTIAIIGVFDWKSLLLDEPPRFKSGHILRNEFHFCIFSMHGLLFQLWIDNQICDNSHIDFAFNARIIMWLDLCPSYHDQPHPSHSAWHLQEYLPITCSSYIRFCRCFLSVICLLKWQQVTLAPSYLFAHLWFILPDKQLSALTCDCSSCSLYHSSLANINFSRARSIQSWNNFILDTKNWDM